MDFEDAVKAAEEQLPTIESWRIAFGLTVIIVWLYLELLRLIAQVREKTGMK